MKKSLLLLPLAMVLVGCVVKVEPESFVYAKTAKNETTALYSLTNPNGAIEQFMMPTDFADVGDTIVYSNRMFFAVKSHKK